MTTIKKKIGIALGSGGARGLAHIGVLKALEEEGIPISYIAGSSMGALVGGLYASGMSVAELEALAKSTHWKELFTFFTDVSLRSGMIRGKKIQNFIEEHLKGKIFEECIIPFVSVATNVHTGETVSLDSGDLSMAIRASISIPLVFRPVKIHNQWLVDGGVSSPVPVDIVRSMGADIVLAINLDTFAPPEHKKTSWYDIANNSFSILRHHLARLHTQKADIVLDIPIGKTQWYLFNKAQDKIELGYTTAQKQIFTIKEINTL